MKANQTIEKKARRRVIILIAGVALLLSIPLVAMLYTDEVQWSPLDFFVAGFLLSGTALGLEIILRKVKNKALKIISIMLLFIMLILVWAELAVGIFGTPLAGS